MVYILKMEAAGQAFYKIGRTVQPIENRMADLQTGNPFDISVYACYHVGNDVATEAYMHGYFARKQVRGEWFKLSRRDLRELNLMLTSAALASA